MKRKLLAILALLAIVYPSDAELDKIAQQASDRATVTYYEPLMDYYVSGLKVKEILEGEGKDNK